MLFIDLFVILFYSINSYLALLYVLSFCLAFCFIWFEEAEACIIYQRNAWEFMFVCCGGSTKLNAAVKTDDTINLIDEFQRQVRTSITTCSSKLFSITINFDQTFGHPTLFVSDTKQQIPRSFKQSRWYLLCCVN